MEVPLTVPAVIRLGGNAEERAITILERAQEKIPAPVEGYGKDDSPEFCASRLDTLIKAVKAPLSDFAGLKVPQPREPYTFETVTGGRVTLDHSACRDCESKICIKTCVPGILVVENDLPVLNISGDEAKKGGCIECLACEIECYFEGNRGGRVDLPLPELEK
jgi:succinyl-CoA synthetase beta subunit